MRSMVGILRLSCLVGLSLAGVLWAGEAEIADAPARHICAVECSEARETCFRQARGVFAADRARCDLFRESLGDTCGERIDDLSTDSCRRARRTLRDCEHSRRLEFRHHLRECLKATRACFTEKCGLAGRVEESALAPRSPTPSPAP